MSGDLKDPGRSLPRGTFLAVGLSMLVYFSAALVFAAARPGAQLVADDTQAMRGIAILPGLVDAGVIAATLSSALASFLGRAAHPAVAGRRSRLSRFSTPSPRARAVGQPAAGRAALGGDRLRHDRPGQHQRHRAGRLDVLPDLLRPAQLRHLLEARANSPSFRPRFRFFHARLSLVGGLGCLGAMLAIHPTAGAVALAVLFAIHQYLARTVSVNRWADSERSRRFQRVREDLLAISSDRSTRGTGGRCCSPSPTTRKRRRRVCCASPPGWRGTAD